MWVVGTACGHTGCGVNNCIYEVSSAPQQGWECPRCSAVFAPWMAQCLNCTGFTAQGGTTTTVDPKLYGYSFEEEE